MVIVPVRDPSGAASPQATSSTTVSWGPVNRATDSGEANVRELRVLDPFDRHVVADRLAGDAHLLEVALVGHHRVHGVG